MTNSSCRYGLACLVVTLACLLLPRESRSDSLKSERQLPPGERMALSMFPENWVDLIGRPCPVKEVGYRHAIDSEAIAPERMTLDTNMLSAQSRESRFIALLGTDFRIIDSAAFYSPEQGNRFISDLMQTHRNTMHYHHLRSFENITGWLKTSAWTLANGTVIRVHFKANTKSGIYRGFLMFVTLPQATTSVAELRSVEGNLVVSRTEPIRAEWNLSSNTLTLSSK